MRWFLGLVLVVALIAGVLYGVGRFLLPNSLAVTRTVSIERPRAAVFAMSNDLRIVKEWSPFYAQDPDAEYAFSGDPGPGQTMRWNSAVREVGAGQMSIVDSVENQSVTSILQLGDRATLNSALSISTAAKGSAVTWEMTAECAATWVNVPCRYMNLVLRRVIGKQMESGLGRLKTLAEQLPNVNFEGADIQTVPVESEAVLFVDVTISGNPTFADREQAERDGIDALNRYLATTNGEVQWTGGLVRVFPPPSGAGSYSFSVGFPYSGPSQLRRLVGVRAGQTPTGAALRANFVGRRSQIPTMYQKLDAYMQSHRISMRPGTVAWEVVRQTEPPPADSADQSDPIEHTEIYYPID